jgi:hypothetical protein
MKYCASCHRAPSWASRPRPSRAWAPPSAGSCTPRVPTRAAAATPRRATTRGARCWRASGVRQIDRQTRTACRRRRPALHSLNYSLTNCEYVRVERVGPGEYCVLEVGLFLTHSNLMQRECRCGLSLAARTCLLRPASVGGNMCRVNNSSVCSSPHGARCGGRGHSELKRDICGRVCAVSCARRQVCDTPLSCATLCLASNPKVPTGRGSSVRSSIG